MDSIEYINSVNNAVGKRPKAAMSRYQIVVQDSSAVTALCGALDDFYFGSYIYFILNIYNISYVIRNNVCDFFFPSDLTLLLFLNLVVYISANLIGYNYKHFKVGKPLIYKY